MASVTATRDVSHVIHRRPHCSATYAVVPDQRAFTEEPYGLGFNEKHVDFVRFVNSRLEEMRTNGEWTRIYDRWLRGSLGPAPKPPIAVYGRTR